MLVSVSWCVTNYSKIYWLQTTMLLFFMILEMKRAHPHSSLTGFLLGFLIGSWASNTQHGSLTLHGCQMVLVVWVLSRGISSFSLGLSLWLGLLQHGGWVPRGSIPSVQRQKLQLFKDPGSGIMLSLPLHFIGENRLQRRGNRLHHLTGGDDKIPLQKCTWSGRYDTVWPSMETIYHSVIKKI